MTLPISTERLFLRNLTYDDIHHIIELLSHPSVARITTNLQADGFTVKEYIGHAYGFSTLGLHRIYAKTSSVNSASVQVMERLDMRKEAHLRESEARDGKWIDTLIYAILADEWQRQDRFGVSSHD